MALRPYFLLMVYILLMPWRYFTGILILCALGFLLILLVNGEVCFEISNISPAVGLLLRVLKHLLKVLVLKNMLYYVFVVFPWGYGFDEVSS